MFLGCKTSPPRARGRHGLGEIAALALLAAGLGQGVSVFPPVADMDRALPNHAAGALQVLPPITDTQQQVFVNEAGQLNLLEAQLGELALLKSSRPAVQDYARRMIADHRRLNEELAPVAEASHLKAPTKLDATGAQTATRLAALRGADFDSAYLKASVSDHEAGLATFENVAAGTATSGVPLPRVVHWARQTVPLLHEQLRLGQTTHQHLAAVETAGGM